MDNQGHPKIIETSLQLP